MESIAGRRGSIGTPLGPFSNLDFLFLSKWRFITLKGPHYLRKENGKGNGNNYRHMHRWRMSVMEFLRAIIQDWIHPAGGVSVDFGGL
jgi:hypothetical protein